MVLLLCWLLFSAIRAENVTVVEVETEDQLSTMSTNQYGFYLLKRNIVLTKPWVPVTSFGGVLDGQGYTISNITFSTSENTTHTGFFAVLREAQVYDITFQINASITLANPTTKTPEVGVGAVAGSAFETVFYLVTVEGTLNVSANFDHQSASLFVGGAVGNYECAVLAGSGLYSNVRLSVDTQNLKFFAVGGTVGQLRGRQGFTDITAGDNCIVHANAMAVTNMTVGGIVGAVRSASVFRYTTSSVNLVNATLISGTAYVGGAIGMASVLQHIDSVAQRVKCHLLPGKDGRADCYVGGVVGGLFTQGENTTASVRLRSTSSSSIVECISKTGSACHAGGVIGGLHQVIINDCVSYAAPIARGSGWIAVGGLVGTLRGGRVIGGRVYLDRIEVLEKDPMAEVHLGGLIGDATRKSTTPFVSIGESYVRVKTIRASVANIVKVGGLVGAHRTTSESISEIGGEIYSCCVVLDKIEVSSTKAVTNESAIVTAVGGMAGSLFYVTVRDTYVTYDDINVTAMAAGVGGLHGISLNSRVGTAFAVGRRIRCDKQSFNGTDSIGEVYVGGVAGYTKFSTIRHTYSDTDLIEVLVTSCNSTNIGGFVGYSSTSRYYLSYSTANNISLTRDLGSYNLGGFVGLATVGVGSYDFEKTWAYSNIELRCPPGASCTQNNFCNVGGYAGKASGLMDIRYSYVEGTIRSSDPEFFAGLFVGRQTASIVMQSISTMSFSGTAKSGNSITWAGYLTNSSTRPEPCNGCLYATDLSGVMPLSDLTTNPVFSPDFASKEMIRNFTVSELKLTDTYNKDMLGKAYFRLGNGSTWYKDETNLPFLPSMPYRAVRLTNIESKDREIKLYDGCTSEFCWSAAANSKVKGSWTIKASFSGRPVFIITTYPCKSWSLCSTINGDDTPNLMTCASNAKGSFCNECAADSFCGRGGKCNDGICNCLTGFGGRDCSTQYCRLTPDGLCGGKSNTCRQLFGGDQHTCVCGASFTKFDGICIRSPAALSAEPKEGVVIIGGDNRRSGSIGVALISLFATLLIIATIVLIIFLLRIYVCKAGMKFKKSSSMHLSTSNLSVSRSMNNLKSTSADHISLMA